ncbi:hypothetical protein N2K95_02060 [Arthrobacter zhaoxinii]|uniref:Uncharacterized protein n=1 Tax=Arthrobacter zhaoxinii TaxID=2964616 RepID=A0ABY5YV29_9MICC|nr:hypothetical protein [Arthrobacter zhaoxinii]UWX97500.1 hypothetical protein N2K95_02060 [Arthrobacter zhaoxinii]
MLQTRSRSSDYCGKWGSAMGWDGREASERAADRNAAGWLSAATAAGALVGMCWLLAGRGSPGLGSWLPSLLVLFGAGLLAAVLLVVVWALTARHEARLGIRQQRGALAALAGLALFGVPFTPDLVFSPVFGAALLLLAVRTRDARTAAMGFTALAAALALAVSPELPGAAVILGLVTVAAASVPVQLRRADARAAYSPR